MVEQLWQRVSEGRHTALLEIVPGEPPPGLGVRIVRVRCDVPEATLGPLVEVRTKIERLVGDGPPLLDRARTRIVSGIRQRLLGDIAEAHGDSDFIEACNRLARSTDHRCALIFDAIESADQATLDVLRRVVSRPEALRVALVLSFRLAMPLGVAGELLAVVRSIGGPEAVLRAPENAAADAPARIELPLLLRALPAEVLRVLRAGALVGSGFEADLVAALLGITSRDVLEALQRAADGGVLIEDRGEGRFHLSHGAMEALRVSILPSLARAWHRRLAMLLSDELHGEDPMNLYGADHEASPAKVGGSGPPTQSTSALSTPRERRILGVSGPSKPRAEEGSARSALAPPARSTHAAQPPVAAEPTPRPPPHDVPAIAPTPRPPPPTPPQGSATLGAGAYGGGEEPESSSAPGLPVPRGATPRSPDTLRPPPSMNPASSASDASPSDGSHRHPVPSQVGHDAHSDAHSDAHNVIATPPPGAPPWSYSDLFARGSDGRRSDPPESLAFEGPPDSLDAPIPGPVRMPRDLGPISTGALPEERSVGSVRSVRGIVSRVPESVTEEAAGTSRSIAPWIRSAVSSGGTPRWNQPAPGQLPLDALRPAGLPSFSGSLPPGVPSFSAQQLPVTWSRAAQPVVAARRSEDARAAAHLHEAGDLDEAARRYCAAAAQAMAFGAHGQALGYGQKALALLDGLPITMARRQLRISALTGVARVQWQDAGPDPSFTLAAALDVLDAARALLTPYDPPELHTDVAVLIASVCYDLGDLRSLERAIEELSGASRMLLDGGDAIGSARLLNDQAAVYVRMGDPVRAAHLLSESRRVFEERAGSDPIARIEIAETDHLFARIPLHVAARPGRESDALGMGLDHAIAAERIYKQLGANRELARVWETMGRLEFRKGRLERASQRLASALEVQQALGDLVGLARSTAALSEVLAAKGQSRDALVLLGESVAMNLEKGSPIGLAFNRRALNALMPSLSLQGEAAEVLRKLAMQLSSAETILGRLKLPGEID